MKDRIPRYPGRVKLTPVPGELDTYDMVRADEPTEAGTPLNKATFLKDGTAEAYGLSPGTAVPDDALAMLSLDAETKGMYGLTNGNVPNDALKLLSKSVILTTGQIQTSKLFIDWVRSVNNSGDTFFDITGNHPITSYGPNIIIYKDSTRILVSENGGLNFTHKSLVGNLWRFLTYTDTKGLIYEGYGSTQMAVSTDMGKTFTNCTGLSNLILTHIAYADGLFVGMYRPSSNTATGHRYYSSDGINWTFANNSDTVGETLFKALNCWWYLSDSVGGRLYYTTDSITSSNKLTWTAVPNFNAIRTTCVFKGKLYFSQLASSTSSSGYDQSRLYRMDSPTSTPVLVKIFDKYKEKFTVSDEYLLVTSSFDNVDEPYTYYVSTDGVNFTEYSFPGIFGNAAFSASRLFVPTSGGLLSSSDKFIEKSTVQNPKGENCTPQLLDAIDYHVHTGSYIGTGSYGRNKPNALTFDFHPKMVVVISESYYSFIWIRDASKCGLINGNADAVGTAYDNTTKTFTWWSSSNAADQLNESNRTYYFMAI